MKSIQKSLSSELEEIIQNVYNTGYDSAMDESEGTITRGFIKERFIQNRVKDLSQLFKTKWLEMVNSPIELGTFNSDEKDLDKLEQQIIGAMKLRAQLRQQISKEEI